MTDSGFGISFLPGSNDAQQQQRNIGPAPLQQAVQMLSLRLPKVTGAQGLAPGPLLQSPGGSGVLELLRAMFGQGRMQQQPPTFASQSAGAASSLPPSMPPPHVIPSGNTGGGGQPPRTGSVQDLPRTGTPGLTAPLGSGAWTGSRTDKYDFNQQGNTSWSGF